MKRKASENKPLPVPTYPVKVCLEVDSANILYCICAALINGANRLHKDAEMARTGEMDNIAGYLEIRAEGVMEAARQAQCYLDENGICFETVVTP